MCRAKGSTKHFDANKDALFSHAERDGDSWLFISYGCGDWRPGGYQPIVYHPRSGALFASMHSGRDLSDRLHRRTPTLCAINPIDATVIRYTAAAGFVLTETMSRR
ncbi:hypothetical protein SAMN04488498_14512 [Mesorhizobium albiziae]|uniref:Uncharacterized protein n=1 Tax=Neomesorhizobium albiziae TaxID=335020 RepID=A0A1I4FFD0_9HYPH|nr:hypothetical protein [Mesorhizobium albiziae]GLS32624.1 hypothetical protein GCM10007937_43340 [Mesorhizobium albiziae]SFL16654.1 hypothetical protein SAMN04488498_14512 [Mesorhizobium albiziae]